jgi:hypothetical protein
VHIGHQRVQHVVEPTSLMPTILTCCSMQLGFDTKLDPAVGMAAVAGTVALFLHLHLPTSAPPLLPEAQRRHDTNSATSPADRPKQQQQQPGQQNGAAAPDAGMQHSDSGWSLVSAGDAGSGAPAGSQNRASTNGAGGVAPEAPSEATRTGAANAQQALDPAAGAEGRAGGTERGFMQTAARPPQGGAFLPSADELQSISGDARPSHGGAATTGGGSAGDRGAARMRRAAGEASKVAVSERTCQAAAQLLGKLAAVLELHGPAGIDAS